MDKFKYPKTRDEFMKQAKDVTVMGARSVIHALEQKLAKVSAPLKNEIKFFEEAIEYKKTGNVPKELQDGS